MKSSSLPRAAASPLDGWHVYFMLKLLLFWRGLIDFHPVANLVFFMVLSIPLAPLWRRIRLACALPAAVALLYHDSFLPPITRLFARAGALADFSLAYTVELIGRFISWPIVAAMAVALVLMLLLGRFVRIGVVVLATMLGLVIARTPREEPVPATSTAVAAAPGAARLRAGGTSAELNRILQDFYASEASRVVRLPPPAAAELPFDLVFVHVCSLSWDDLRAVGLDLHPLWRSFDIVFRNFNSAASYSGPAAVRLHRATCGQSSNDGLYAPVGEGCYLMPSLKRAGFDIHFAMNHDGHFDDFLQLIRQQGVQEPPLPLTGMLPAMRAFDDSPIQDDAAVLARWRAVRAASTAPRAALYYNTISLHDGNRLTSGAGNGLDSLQSYKLRATRLFDELEALTQALATGSRRTVLVVIPEHGAALRGDRMQIAGLREIATPAITTVPVGIKIIDRAERGERETVYVDQPSSYLALSQVIARMLEKSPFGATTFDAARYTAALPVTDFVAESQGVVMRVDNRYFWREDRDQWKPFASEPAR